MLKKIIATIFSLVLVITSLSYVPKTVVADEVWLQAPTDVAAYNFYAKDNKYQITFTGVEGATSYNLYVDNSGVITTLTSIDTKLDADLFGTYADGNLHNIYVQSVDAQGNQSEKSLPAKVRITKKSTKVQELNGISSIYVVTNSDATITKAKKTEASLTIIGGENAIKDASYAGSIKLRGNSTSIADKPAYNISFNKKQTVMTGKEKGKKWCLLANAYEKSMLRNKLAMDFGAKLGNVAAPEEHYADLYLDGQYKGTFVISEPAENERSGVLYDETADEVLFELENNDRDESSDGAAYYRAPRSGFRFVTEDLEDDVKALYKAGTTSQTGITNALKSNNTKFQVMTSLIDSFENYASNPNSNEVFKYINMDSFVDMYIVNELFKTVDFGYSSVKFYITHNNGQAIINAGPLWDFDLSSGNTSDAGIRTTADFRCQQVNTWFGWLMRNQTFKEAVLKKFEKMQPYIQNLYQSNSLGTSQIDLNVAQFNDSRIKNYSSKASGGAGWSESVADSAEYNIYRYSYSTFEPYSNYTYAQHVDYLKNWLEERDKWMCKGWNIDYDTSGSLSETTSDMEITGYQMTTTLDGIDGKIGLRVIYQAEDLINSQKPEEVGLVYGLDMNGTMKESDLRLDSDSAYVKSWAATDTGKLNRQMGTSPTAQYYAMTMNTGNDNVTTAAYTTTYYVRPYAKLSDGSCVYGKASAYTVFKVADYLYQNNIVATKSAYEHLYNKVLSFVNKNYVRGDFDWGNTIIK